MAITINGTGSITGLTAGGLPDGSVTADDLATDSVTTAKIEDDAVTTAKIPDANITAAKLDGGQSGSAPIYGCRAWVNFDGTKDTTGATSTANTNRLIRASGNVTSVLRNGVGDYTVTFTTAMPDGNYSIALSASGVYNGTVFCTDGSSDLAPNPRTSSSIRFGTRGGASSGAASDPAYVNVAIFR